MNMPQKKIHIMVDLETLGVGPCPPILSIGAVSFCPEVGIVEKFYFSIKLQKEELVDMDVDTLRWWMQQSNKARAVFNDPAAIPLSQALDRLRTFIKFHDNEDNQFVGIWGNGALADLQWLDNHYIKKGIAVPWGFRFERCYRTIIGILSTDVYDAVKAATVSEDATSHNALDDAIYQARFLLNLHRYGKIVL